MDKFNKYVGLDTHKETIAVAVAIAMRLSSPLRFMPWGELTRLI